MNVFTPAIDEVLAVSKTKTLLLHECAHLIGYIDDNQAEAYAKSILSSIAKGFLPEPNSIPDVIIKATDIKDFELNLEPCHSVTYKGFLFPGEEKPAIGTLLMMSIEYKDGKKSNFILNGFVMPVDNGGGEELAKAECGWDLDERNGGLKLLKDDCSKNLDAAIKANQDIRMQKHDGNEYAINGDAITYNIQNDLVNVWCRDGGAGASPTISDKDLKYRQEHPFGATSKP